MSVRIYTGSLFFDVSSDQSEEVEALIGNDEPLPCGFSDVLFPFVQDELSDVNPHNEACQVSDFDSRSEASRLRDVTSKGYSR